MFNPQTRDAQTPDVAALSDLDLPELRSLWRQHYPGDPPKRMSRELMMRAIAYKLQEKMFGGPSRRTKAKLNAFADRRFRHKDAKTQKSTVTIKPGTQLMRQWHGRVHTVTAADDGGFLYGDQHYRSLSQVARKITGARWSGPVFFGLKAHLVGNDAETPKDRPTNGKRCKRPQNNVPS